MKNLEAASDLRAVFLDTLPARLSFIQHLYQKQTDERQDYSCDIYGRIKRIARLSEIFKLDELAQLCNEQCESLADVGKKDSESGSFFDRLNNYVVPTDQRSRELIDLAPHVSATHSNAAYSIILFIQSAQSQYLTEYLSAREYEVKNAVIKPDLVEEVKRLTHGLVVIDEELVAALDENIYEFIDDLKNANPEISILLVTNNADFEKRLYAAENDFYLIANRESFDVRCVAQAIEKTLVAHDKKKSKILIISEDEVVTEYIQLVLASANFDVSHVVSADTALLGHLNGQVYDLVIIDFHHKKYSGNVLAKIIRQSDAYTYAPILFLYSRIYDVCDKKVDSLCRDGYIQDIVSPDEFVASINKEINYSFSSQRLGNYMADALRENENRRVMLDAHCIVSVSDIHGTILDVNDKFCEISGYSREELIGKSHNIINSRRHSKEFFSNMWKTISSGKIWHGEICNRKKDGSYYWVESTIVPFLDDFGNPYQYVSARTDITDIKNAEEAIRSREGRLQRSQKFANIGTWDWDIQTGELYWSQRIATLFGYGEGELETTYENFLNAVHPDDREFVITSVNNCVEKGVNYDIEHRCVWPDGTVRWMMERGDVIRDKNGKPLHMLGVVQDITDRKNAELKQIVSEQRLREAQKIGRIGSWSLDVDSGELDWSEEIYRIFGWGVDEKPNYEKFFNAVHPDDVERVKESEKKAYEQGETHSVDHRIVLPNGEIRWVHEEAIAKFDKNKKPVSLRGTVQDITENKLAEEKLKNNQMMLILLRDGLSQFVEDRHIENISDYILEGLLELTGSEYGFTSEVAHDENDQPYLIVHAITNIAWSQETLDFYMKHFGSEMEFRNMNTLFGQAVVTGKAVISNYPANDPRSGGLPQGHPPLNAYMGVPVFYGNELVGMYSIANKEGGYTEEMLEFLKPFNATYGAILHAKKMAESQQKILTELQVSKEIAETASRAKSEFLASMSHELRTPLNAILGFSQLLEMEIGQKLTDAQRDNVQEILKAGSHLLTLINEILDLSKIESGNVDLFLEPVSVDEVIRGSLSIIKPIANKKHIAIKYQGDDSGSVASNYHINADKVRLKQILLNLLSNAVKYNKNEGYVEIKIIPSGENKIRVSIVDSGKGIPEDKHDELFQSFNRFGAENTDVEGAGIGLVITRKLVEMQGGEIGFNSVLNKGSEFWFEFPLHHGPDPIKLQKKDEKEIELSNDGRRTVLYIEDNPANLRLISQVLSALGDVSLITAHDPALGLDLIWEHQPDLVLLDINLPGMSGHEVFDRLQSNDLSKDIPVVALSANAMPDDIKKCMKMGFKDYITKPVDVSKLIDTLNGLLK